MASKKKTTSIFSELKESVADYRRLLKTLSKDFILVLFIFFLVLLYFIILNRVIPPQPGFNQDTVWMASAQQLDSTTASLELFYYTFIASSIIGIILIALALNFTKEWVWSGFRKQKISMKSQPKFLALNIVLYLVGSLIAVGLILLSGFLMQLLTNAGASMITLQIIGIIFLIIITPIVLQIINYSSYAFVKKRKFFQNIKETFFSFSKTKHLLLPYLFILIVVSIIGLIVNFLVYSVKNPPVLSGIASLVAIILFIMLLSWEKIYSFVVFERVYK